MITAITKSKVKIRELYFKNIIKEIEYYFELFK